MPRNDRQTGWLWMDEIGDSDTRGRRSGAASEGRLDWKREVGAAAEEGCQIRGMILEVPSTPPIHVHVRVRLPACDRSGLHHRRQLGEERDQKRGSSSSSSSNKKQATSNSNNKSSKAILHRPGAPERNKGDQ